jgi:hypothetical protein
MGLRVLVSSTSQGIVTHCSFHPVPSSALSSVVSSAYLSSSNPIKFLQISLRIQLVQSEATNLGLHSPCPSPLQVRDGPSFPILFASSIQRPPPSGPSHIDVLTQHGNKPRQKMGHMQALDTILDDMQTSQIQ